MVTERAKSDQRHAGSALRRWLVGIPGFARWLVALDRLPAAPTAAPKVRRGEAVRWLWQREQLPEMGAASRNGGRLSFWRVLLAREELPRRPAVAAAPSLWRVLLSRERLPPPPGPSGVPTGAGFWRTLLAREEIPPPAENKASTSRGQANGANKQRGE